MNSSGPRPAWLGRAVIAALGLNLAGIAVAAGGLSAEAAPWLALACGEGLLLWGLLRPTTYDYSSGRALACLFAALIGSIMAGVTAGTTPTPQSIAHMLWLLGLLVALAILLGISLWIRLLERN